MLLYILTEVLIWSIQISSQVDRSSVFIIELSKSNGWLLHLAGWNGIQMLRQLKIKNLLRQLLCDKWSRKNSISVSEAHQRLSRLSGRDVGNSWRGYEICSDQIIHVIIGSDCQIAIWAISGEIKAPNIISNILRYLYFDFSCKKNLKFLYCNRHANTLADSLAKMVHHCNVQTISIINNI